MLNEQELKEVLIKLKSPGDKILVCVTNSPYMREALILDVCLGYFKVKYVGFKPLEEYCNFEDILVSRNNELMVPSHKIFPSVNHG